MFNCIDCKHSQLCSNQSPCHECTDSNKFEPKFKFPTITATPSKTKALDTQIGGSHYKNMSIQPAEYCQRNKLSWCESNVVKYASRHGQKNGIEDIKKAIHYLKLLAQMDYNIEL